MRSITGFLAVWLLALLLLPAAASEPQGDDLVAVFFDVRDIVSRQVDRAAPLERDSSEPPDRESAEATETMRLAEIIRIFVTPPLRGEGETIDAIRGQILARVRPEQRDWIAGFLRRRRDHPDLLVQLDVTFLTADSEAFERLEIGDEPETFETEEERAAFLETALGGPGVHLITSPKLTVLDLYEATITIANQFHFVLDYKVYEKVEPGGRGLVVPVVETLQDGVVFEGRAATLEDDLVALDFKLELTELQRPVKTATTENGEIALPALEKIRVASKVLLADGACALFPASDHGGRHPILLIQARIIRPEQGIPR